MENPKPFRFAIMGAGIISHQFCDAVALIDGAEIAAVASKSMERAKAVAGAHGLPAAYDDYALMLERERPDCVYIATTPNSHYELCMLSLGKGIPVLCEKAMFLNSKEAEEVFSLSERTGVFAMEAMWSRFLPALKKARGWISEGRIGKVRLLETTIGFLAPPDNENRYRNPALGGGPAYDITVYAYELADFFLGEESGEGQVSAIWGESGVSLTEHVALPYGDALASLTTTFAADTDEKSFITGEKGRIMLPRLQFGPEAYLFDPSGGLIEHYIDDETKNGFTYEILEVMASVRAGKVESAVVPHSLTRRCARLFDRIAATHSGWEIGAEMSNRDS